MTTENQPTNSMKQEELKLDNNINIQNESINNIGDPYLESTSEDQIQDYYDNLEMYSIPIFEDKSFEFEPQPTSKSLEDYTLDPHTNMEVMKTLSIYTTEMEFIIRGIYQFYNC